MLAFGLVTARGLLKYEISKAFYWSQKVSSDTEVDRRWLYGVGELRIAQDRTISMWTCNTALSLQSCSSVGQAVSTDTASLSSLVHTLYRRQEGDIKSLEEPRQPVDSCFCFPASSLDALIEVCPVR